MHRRPILAQAEEQKFFVFAQICKPRQVCTALSIVENGTAPSFLLAKLWVRPRLQVWSKLLLKLLLHPPLSLMIGILLHLGTKPGNQERWTVNEDYNLDLDLDSPKIV